MQSRETTPIEDRAISTRTQTFVVLLWVVIGIAFGAGITLASVRGDVAQLKDSDVSRTSDIKEMRAEIKAISSKLDRINGYLGAQQAAQRNAGGQRNPFVAPIDDAPPRS